MEVKVQDGAPAEVFGGLRAVADDARRDFGRLTAEQLNWKPSADSWSVAQVFEHLVKTNESYFPLIEEIVRGERKTTALERFSPLSGLWGKFLIKALQPESPRKLKTTRKFAPSASDIDARVVEHFAESQKRLAGMAERTAGLDLRRVIVTSPFNGLVTYSLLDAYRGVVAHVRRHFAQARRVTESAGFPRGEASPDGGATS